MESGKWTNAFLLIGLLGIVAGCSCRSDETSERQRVLVFAVHDGDSVKAKMGDGQILDVRLDGIDAPELDQGFGESARDELSALVLHKTAILEVKGQDRYGRTLAELFTDDEVSVNRELVARGLAWHFKRYSSDEGLASLEVAARKHARGLWAESEPVPPWDHRAKRRRERASAKTAISETDGPVRGNLRSRRYHLPDCRDYDEVSPKNRVGFATEEQAVDAGFRKAGNCK